MVDEANTFIFARVLEYVADRRAVCVLSWTFLIRPITSFPFNARLDLVLPKCSSTYMYTYGWQISK